MSIYNDPIDYDMYGSYEDRYTMTCDCCGESLSDGYGFFLFDDMIEAAKRSDWRLVKNESGEWYHYCPVCANRLGIRTRPSAAQDFEGVGAG